MHLFATTTADQALESGKMSAVTEVQAAHTGEVVGVAATIGSEDKVSKGKEKGPGVVLR
jgi:hypothetical protein